MHLQRRPIAISAHQWHPMPLENNVGQSVLISGSISAHSGSISARQWVNQCSSVGQSDLVAHLEGAELRLSVLGNGPQPLFKVGGIGKESTRTEREASEQDGPRKQCMQHPIARARIVECFGAKAHRKRHRERLVDSPRPFEVKEAATDRRGGHWMRTHSHTGWLRPPSPPSPCR